VSKTIKFEAKAWFGKWNKDEQLANHRLMIEVPRTINGAAPYKVTMTPIEPELLPCHMCGGQMNGITYDLTSLWKAECSSCGGLVYVESDDETDAINKLNQRA